MAGIQLIEMCVNQWINIQFGNIEIRYSTSRGNALSYESIQIIFDNTINNDCKIGVYLYSHVSAYS